MCTKSLQTTSGNLSFKNFIATSCCFVWPGQREIVNQALNGLHAYSHNHSHVIVFVLPILQIRCKKVFAKFFFIVRSTHRFLLRLNHPISEMSPCGKLTTRTCLKNHIIIIMQVITVTNSLAPFTFCFWLLLNKPNKINMLLPIFRFILGSIYFRKG